MRGIAPSIGACALLLGAWWSPSGPHRTDGFVTVSDGVRIHYIEAGSGPSILFVTGWAIPADIWNEQIDHFADHYRVVAIDPRSQGRSSLTTQGLFPEVRATDIKAVIARLRLAPTVLVGWSMGAQDIAAYVDQSGTHDVAGMVFVDGGAGGGSDAALAPMFLQFLGAYQRDPRATMASFVRSLFATPQPDSTIVRLIAAASAIPPTVAMAQYIGTVTSNHRAALAKIDRPTLLVFTAETKNLMEAMKTTLRDSRLESFAGAGHAVFVDEPDRFDAVLGAFVAYCRSASSMPSKRP